MEQLSSQQMYDVERAILIDTPYVTPEEFARRTGMSVSAVRNKLDRGELPYYQPTKKRSSRRMVNMALLCRQALEQEGGILHD